eukprot:TRINITY_DN15585_c0_g1_i1.p1 TRINITY_DN15585_c0_g1~~TRINITY_DN15585_c0_g1_i1.p1  ORF type:complete len:515 (-),score=102.32 TRINITY_DN15585_c0_g1_i1:59-1603(-)
MCIRDSINAEYGGIVRSNMVRTSTNRGFAPEWNTSVSGSFDRSSTGPLDGTAGWMQQPSSPGGPFQGNGMMAQSLSGTAANQDPNQILSTAASQGDHDRLNAALAAGADPNSRDWCGWTSLHWAISAGQTNTVQLLLRVGADVNAADNHDDTSLHWASHFNNEPICRMLINQGGNINAVNDQGQYPMDMTRAPIIREMLQIQPQQAPAVQQPAPMSSFIGALPLNASATDKTKIQGLASRLDAERRARVNSERKLTKIADIKVAVDDLRIQLVSAEKGRKDSEQRITDLRPELERQRAAREDAERVLRDQRQRLEDVTQRLETATTNLQVASHYAKQKRDMEQALAEDTDSMERAQMEIERTKRDFDLARKEEAEKTNSVKMLQKMNDSLANELQKKERQVNETMSQMIGREKEQFAKLRADEMHKQRELDELEAEVKRWADDSKRYRDDLTRAERTREEKAREQKNMTTSFATLTKRISELESEKKSLEQKVYSKKELFRTKQTEISRLERGM